MFNARSWADNRLRLYMSLKHSQSSGGSGISLCEWLCTNRNNCSKNETTRGKSFLTVYIEPCSSKMHAVGAVSEATLTPLADLWKTESVQAKFCRKWSDAVASRISHETKRSQYSDRSGLSSSFTMRVWSVKSLQNRHMFTHLDRWWHHARSTRPPRKIHRSRRRAKTTCSTTK